MLYNFFETARKSLFLLAIVHPVRFWPVAIARYCERVTGHTLRTTLFAFFPPQTAGPAPLLTSKCTTHCSLQTDSSGAVSASWTTLLASRVFSSGYVVVRPETPQGAATGSCGVPASLGTEPRIMPGRVETLGFWQPFSTYTMIVIVKCKPNLAPGRHLCQGNS